MRRAGSRTCGGEGLGQHSGYDLDKVKGRTREGEVGMMKNDSLVVAVAVRVATVEVNGDRGGLYDAQLVLVGEGPYTGQLWDN
jgi:hypothetical protein